MDLVDKFVALSEEMQKTKDVNLEKRYTVLQSQIANVNLMVQASGYGRLKKLPYYYNNTETEFSNQVIDSLYQSTSTELGQIEEELVAIATSLVVAENNIKPEKRAQMLQTAYNISQWRNELDRRIGRDLLKIQSIPDLDLTRWSHVAFHKTMVPGADFNDLKAEQKRVKDIEKFLQSIDNISNQLGVKLQP
jgi:hypothetical protein